jgi:hypothetical protein
MRRMRRADRGLLAVAMGLFLGLTQTSVLVAQEESGAANATAGASEQHSDTIDDHAVHAEHVNAIAVFLGNTAERSDDSDTVHSGFTFGIEYIRRLSPHISLAAVIERAGGDVRGTLALGQIYYRFTGGFALIAGAGAEFRDGHSEEVAPHGRMIGAEGPTHREGEGTVFLARVGAMYEWEFDRWLFGPMAAIDFVGRDEAFVLGVNFGYAF